MSCPFCYPARERVRFALAPGAAALVNLRPIGRGHSLVVPDRHVERLVDLSPDEIAGLAAFARQVSAFLMEETGASGMDWTLQDGPEAGLTVMHFQFHLIPRAPGDLPSPGDWYPELQASHARPALPDAELRTTVDRLRGAVRWSKELGG